VNKMICKQHGMSRSGWGHPMTLFEQEKQLKICFLFHARHIQSAFAKRFKDILFFVVPSDQQISYQRTVHLKSSEKHQGLEVNVFDIVTIYTRRKNKR